MTRPLLAISNLIIDHIIDADGSARNPTLGGAGLYAAAAMRMWWPHVALFAGVGRNLHDFTNDAFRSYGFDPRGFLTRDEHCIESQLVYHGDGSRSETPTHGRDHFERLQTTISDIDPELLPAAGCYVFMDTNRNFWDQFGQRRSDFGLAMWEIDCAAATPEHRKDVASIAPLVDVLSLNLAEGHSLLGEQLRPEALLSELEQLGFRSAVLRMGADGAIASYEGQRIAVRPPASDVIDVTGGGNAFSGGFLAGLLKFPGDPISAMKCAAAAAAKILAQPGLPSLPDPTELNALSMQTTIEIH